MLRIEGVHFQFLAKLDGRLHAKALLIYLQLAVMDVVYMCAVIELTSMV